MSSKSASKDSASYVNPALHPIVNRKITISDRKVITGIVWHIHAVLVSQFQLNLSC